ncbi:MAG: hypothetical protein V1773_18580 [bacterium]
MKKYLVLVIGLFLTSFFTACDVTDNETNNDYTAPAPPTNVYSVTGDERVDIFWDYNTERDVAGYSVYYSYSYDGTYTYIGSTTKNYFIDTDVSNGETYFYAVTAYDNFNNESELSYDEVFDTPRPEGFNQTIFNYRADSLSSGYDFLNNSVVSYNSNYTDFFFENYLNKYYLDVWSDTDIQDMGVTTDIYDISYAPTTGYVPLNDGDNIKYVEAIIGHTYVIWTVDNHYAKVRVTNITRERITFDWAYQTAEGNRELKRNVIINRNVPDTVKVSRY